MRRFHLQRGEDVTGVSGTGAVAEGVEFSDGTAVLRWRPVANDNAAGTSTAVWSSTDDLIRIHGHDGATRIEYLD